MIIGKSLSKNINWVVFCLIAFCSFGQAAANLNKTSALFQPSDLIYNEKPAGVKLVKSEEEWLRLSPSEPCCCYPQFNDYYKGYGLLYNYLAYKLIKNQLKISNQGITVCSESDWNKQLKEVQNDHTKMEKLKLSYYPGFFDGDWFGPDLKMAGYWYNENSVLNFSQDAYGEAMLDDNLYDDGENKRRSMAALSIRLVKSAAISCGQNNWGYEASFFKGPNNSIQFVSNKSDWVKYTKKGKACCCYLNFDIRNENLGFLYNKTAFQLLITDPTIKNLGYRMVTEFDWSNLIKCAKENDNLSYVFNCDKEDLNQFSIYSNGYFNDIWYSSNSNYCHFWVRDFSSESTILQVDCNTASINKKFPVDNSAAYFIQLIKINDGYKNSSGNDLFLPSTKETNEGDLEEIADVAEEDAEFPGGYEKMSGFINEYLVYPNEAIDLGVNGKVIVRFVVEKDGRISNASVERPIVQCPDCNKEALAVVNKFPP